jgi:NAD(P) transhydrogenase
VVTTLQDGQVITGDKMLVALGRQANLEDLNLTATGLTVTEKGTLAVNEHCQTTIPHIYGVGDLIGPPGLASSGMEQGRRAVCHALGLPEDVQPMPFRSGSTQSPRCPVSDWTKRQVENDTERS